MNKTLKKMVKAIQISANGGLEALKYVDVELPQLKEDQVLVKNHAIGVNFIDTYQRSGLYPTAIPFILGREGAGVIEQVGSNVKDFKVGERVAYFAQGSYAESTVVSGNTLTKLPDQISFETGAASLLQGLTAWTMVKESYRVQPGDTVLIHAVAGGMGLLLTQLSKILGAKVIGTTSTAEKAELAKKFGADHVINYTTEAVAQKVLEFTNNQGVQAVFDGVGKDTFEASIASCDYLATLVSYGNASGKVPPVDIFKLTPKNLKLMRTSLFNFFNKPGAFDKYSQELFKTIIENNIQISVFENYKLENAAKAHSDLESRKSTGKLLLHP